MDSVGQIEARSVDYTAESERHSRWREELSVFVGIQLPFDIMVLEFPFLLFELVLFHR